MVLGSNTSNRNGREQKNWAVTGGNEETKYLGFRNLFDFKAFCLVSFDRLNPVVKLSYPRPL